MTPVDIWQSEHLDCTHMLGNRLYLKIGTEHDYLLSSDIHEFVTKYSRHFRIKRYPDVF